MEQRFKASAKRRLFCLISVFLVIVIITRIISYLLEHVVSKVLSINTSLLIAFFVFCLGLLMYYSTLFFKPHYQEVIIGKDVIIIEQFTQKTIYFKDIKKITYKRGIWNKSCSLKLAEKTYTFYYMDFVEVKQMYESLQNCKGGIII